MGSLFSRFRAKEKEESTLDKLNKLESRIKSLEEHIQQDRRREKRIWFWFLLIAGFLYVSVAGIFHAFILERTTVLDYAKLCFLWTTPLFLIYFLQRWIPWYFERGIQDNRDKTRKLREEKKKILDEVRETEPYNKAKAILEKFDPQAVLPKPAAAPQSARPPGPGYQKFPVGPMPMRMPAGAIRGPQPGNYSPQPGRFPAPTQELGYGRPPVPRQRSTFDRMLDYVVKDGPENRMALVCRHCGAHNGLVMLDEFEYTGFRCFECRGPNPSRKPRPSVSAISTPLSTPNMTPSNMSINRISGSESESSSSGEEENSLRAGRGDAVHQAVTKTPVTVARLEAVPVAPVETVSVVTLSDGDTASESDNEEEEAQADLSSSEPLLPSPDVPDLPAVVA